MITFPPRPAVALPVPMFMVPLLPLDDGPDPSKILPLTLVEALPVDKSNMPLTPLLPEFAV